MFIIFGGIPVWKKKLNVAVKTEPAGISCMRLESSHNRSASRPGFDGRRLYSSETDQGWVEGTVSMVLSRWRFFQMPGGKKINPSFLIRSSMLTERMFDREYSQYPISNIKYLRTLLLTTWESLALHPP
jgi:hypothetical protein